MRLVWDTLALADRRALYNYIEPEDPRAAVRIDKRIGDAVRRLIDFPSSGRPGRVEDTRELIVSGTPYIIPYRIAADHIRLLRVLHGAQLWPESFSSTVTAK